METSKHVHNIKNSLNTAIEDAMANMNKEYLFNSGNRFRSSIEAVIEPDDGCIE